MFVWKTDQFKRRHLALAVWQEGNLGVFYLGTPKSATLDDRGPANEGQVRGTALNLLDRWMADDPYIREAEAARRAEEKR